MSTNSRSIHRMSFCAGLGVVMLCSATSRTAGQSVEAVGVPVRWDVAQPQDVPQDVRIMQTIVSTALSEVEAPETPDEPAADSVAARGAWNTARLTYGYGAVAYSTAVGLSAFGRGDVSGFYMQGYGYLFTVRWPVGSASSFYNVAVSVQGGTERLRREDIRSGESAAAWAVEYRQRLSDALRDAIAGYGSTLRRAAPGESITFIADFGGGDSEKVTMTVKADALQGSNLATNRGAIQVSAGETGMSERLRTQLRIMSGIIDTSLRPGAPAENVQGDAWSVYFGGSAEPQYVPGYGVIFRKNGRMNTARAFVSMPTAALREPAADTVAMAARTTYREHLDTLRHRTVEILAIYGPTLTELNDEDWVGIYYDVGSAAALLTGGVDDYLVQSRMGDIRQAAGQSDPAAWLEERLVTNEKGN
jgi:hypothetical protein